MHLIKTLPSVVPVLLAMSTFVEASPVLQRDITYAPVATCTNFGPADEFYYKLSGHSSPLYGVEIDVQSTILTAVKTRDTNVTFQFEKCNAPSTGYVQGEPITQGYAPVYVGHVRHVPSGKCLHHRAATLDFDLGDCPTVDSADAQLPFWFETPSENGVVRYTGYRNTTAYPQPEWFAIPSGGPPFAIATNKDGAQGKANQWALTRPIRV